MTNSYIYCNKSNIICTSMYVYVFRVDNLEFNAVNHVY